MKKLHSTIFLLLAAAVLSLATGCTHNCGDIGDLFGYWRLNSMTADGTPVELYPETAEDGQPVRLYTWAFQSQIVMIHTFYDHEDSSQATGTWQRTDRTLMLDFDHRDDGGTEYYTPPAALKLVEGGVTPLEIILMNPNEMKLSYTADDGVTYEYRLGKLI